MKNEHNTLLQHYSINLRPMAHHTVKAYAPDLGMSQIIQVLLDTQKRSPIQWSLLGNRVMLTIEQFELHEEDAIAYLLVTLSDKDIADPCFTDHETQHTRVEHKKDNEGVSCSAHVAIDLTTGLFPSPQAHRCLVEHATGISRTRLEDFLSAVIRKACKEQDVIFEHADTKYRCWALAEMAIESTSKMQQIFKDGGAIAQFELQRGATKQDAWDEEEYTTLVKETATLGFRVNSPKFVEAIKSVFKKAKAEDYDQITLRITRPDRRQQSVQIPTSISIDDAVDRALGDYELLEIRQKLNQAEEVFVPEIIESMKASLLKKRDAQ